MLIYLLQKQLIVGGFPTIASRLAAHLGKPEGSAGTDNCFSQYKLLGGKITDQEDEQFLPQVRIEYSTTLMDWHTRLMLVHSVTVLLTMMSVFTTQMFQYVLPV